MDTSFTFPSVCTANPPPTLLKVLAEIMPQDSLPDPIRIHNPLHLDNIPDTDIAWVTVHSLARVREALCSPYNTPDATFPRCLWLKLVLEVLASVHKGLRNVQLASPFASPDISNSDALDDLDGDEVALMTRSYEILGWTKDFSQEDGDINGDALHVHCSRCVQSSYLTQSSNAEALSKSLQLTTAIDARAFRESLLNQVLPSIHHNVDAWREKQRGLLLDHIVSIITDPGNDLSGEVISGSAHELDERIRKWVDGKISEIQNFARSRLTNKACENTVDLWATEVVIHRIDAQRRELDAQTDKSFDAEGIEKRRLSHLAKLEALAAEHIAAEEAHLNNMVSTRIGAL
jgi:hypothetical protein